MRLVELLFYFVEDAYCELFKCLLLLKLEHRMLLRAMTGRVKACRVGSAIDKRLVVNCERAWDLLLSFM